MLTINTYPRSEVARHTEIQGIDDILVWEGEILTMFSHWYQVG